MFPSASIVAILPPILEKIYRIKYDFEGRLEIKPTKLYLGKMESDEMLNFYMTPFLTWCSYQHLKNGEIVTETRHSFEGMEIFVVDAENHVGVS